MRFSWVGSGICGAIFLGAGAVTAQEPAVDCKNAVTQADMNICAARDHADADKELNAQYKKTRAAMLARDAELEGDQKGAEKALLKSQRAWIDYRDGECEAEGFQARGGSLEPMLISECMAKLTRQRTKELADLADGQEQ
ncbi:MULTISPECIES: lysozyme inhibitor LprI family protein [unclassified Sinorhizobium]|uniref:lysozyme inhibitor LprI family protein n=1 Tax=unclassified Sinorhizobium TaxID=2613772 RepID=UPI003523BF7E